MSSSARSRGGWFGHNLLGSLLSFSSCSGLMGGCACLLSPCFGSAGTFFGCGALFGAACGSGGGVFSFGCWLGSGSCVFGAGGLFLLPDGGGSDDGGFPFGGGSLCWL